MLLALVALTLTSCGDKDSEGKSRITYYPTIELEGETYMVIDKGSAYVEPGYTSLLNGEDVSDKVVISGSVNTGKSGIYTLTYNSLKNEDGFGSSAKRTVVVLDPNDPVEGFYATDANGYRVREGAQVAYGASYEVLVIGNGDGTYDVDDLLGGWYRDRAGYGSNYALSGTLALADDGTVTCIDSHVIGWGDSHDDCSGTFDFATSTFNITVVYANMDFVQTWVKE